MFKNAVLFVLLLTSYTYGQFILWEPYTPKLGTYINKLKFNKDRSKLYAVTGESLISYDFNNDSVEVLVNDYNITHLFVNNNNIYAISSNNLDYKIHASHDGGKTWGNIIIEHMTSIFIEDNVMYIGRYYKPNSDWYLPPTVYGVWTADSMGNNLKLFHPAYLSNVKSIVGKYKEDIYFYADLNDGKDGVYKCNKDSIKLLTTSNTFYLNSLNGDVLYRKTYDGDSLYKVNSKEAYKIPKIQSILFFDSTNILVACDTSFYLKYSVPYFRKFNNNNLYIVYDMIEDKDNFVLLATTFGVYRSTFKLRWLNTYSNKEDIEDEIDFQLLNNYPNPFNPSTNIKYIVDESKHIKLKVFDLLGKEVKVLVDEFKSAGSYDIDFNGADLPSGVYIYSLTDGKNIISKKMTLIK